MVKLTTAINILIIYLKGVLSYIMFLFCRCDRVLRPLGVDIYHVITTDDKTIFDNIQNSFIGIAAMQIGLTDVLTELGIVPDNIIGM